MSGSLLMRDGDSHGVLNAVGPNTKSALAPEARANSVRSPTTESRTSALPGWDYVWLIVSRAPVSSTQDSPPVSREAADRAHALVVMRPAPDPPPLRCSRCSYERVKISIQAPKRNRCCGSCSECSMFLIAKNLEGEELGHGYAESES